MSTQNKLRNYMYEWLVEDAVNILGPLEFNVTTETEKKINLYFISNYQEHRLFLSTKNLK